MARRARGEGTIHKEERSNRKTKWRGEKTIRLPDGRARRIVVRARNRDDVVPLLRKREAEVRKANPTAEATTLNEYLDDWLAFKATSCKPRTVNEYRDALRRAREEIGDVKLARLTPTHVQRVITAESEAGRKATAANVRRYLKQALRQAEKWGLIEASPVRNIDPVRQDVTPRSVLQPAQIEAFLAAARKVAPAYHPMIYAAIFTGLRIGELVALPWADVSESRVRVRQTAAPGGGVSSPKTAAAHRSVPIARSVFEVIRDGRAVADSEWAFPSRTGTMRSIRNTHRAFARVRKEAELPNLRFHDLRRTAATLWARQGATPKMIQMFLGHASPHLALAIYTQVMDDQMDGAALDPERVLNGGRNGGDAGGRAGS